MIHLKGIMNDIVTPESPESPESPDYNNSNMTNEYQISPDYLILNILAFSLLFYAFGGPIYNCIRKCKDNVSGIIDRGSLSDYLIARETVLNEDIDDEPCSICLEEFVIPNRIIVLACEHKFHSDCIKSWISQDSSCPICRQRISTSFGN